MHIFFTDEEISSNSLLEEYGGTIIHLATKIKESKLGKGLMNLTIQCLYFLLNFYLLVPGFNILLPAKSVTDYPCFVLFFNI